MLICTIEILNIHIHSLVNALKTLPSDIQYCRVDALDRVAWKNGRTAQHYIKLKQVVNPAGAAAKLADLDCDNGKTYMRLNNF